MTKKSVWSWKTTVKTSKSSFKSFCITALLLLGLSVSSFGQGLVIFPKEKYMIGDSLGKSYQVMLVSAVKKKQIVDDFITFLDGYGVCKKKELQARIDQIDDKTTEFAVDFALPAPVFFALVYGMHMPVPPIALTGKLYFEFISNDTVMIDFKNWAGLTFLQYNKDAQNFDMSKINAPAPAEKKGFFKALVDENLGEKKEEVKTPQQLASEEWGAYISQRTKENTALYKAGSAVIGTVLLIDPTATGAERQKVFNYLKDVLTNDWVKRLNEEIPMLKKLQEAEIGGWFTDEMYIAYYSNQPRGMGITDKNVMAAVDLYTNMKAEHKMFSLTEKRWEKQVRPILSLFFKYLAIQTGSNIIAVAEDSKTTYVNINGYVLPVDPKWERDANGTPIVPTDPKVLEKYINSNKKVQY